MDGGNLVQHEQKLSSTPSPSTSRLVMFSALSPLIRSIIITPALVNCDSTAAALLSAQAETPPKQPPLNEGVAELPERLSLHSLHRRLIICGTKRHHCARIVTHIVSELLSLCFPPSLACSGDGEDMGDSNQSNVSSADATLRRLTSDMSASQWNDASCVSLKDLTESLLMSNDNNTSSTLPAPGTSDGISDYVIVTRRDLMEKIIARCFSKELRGQMITTHPTWRWRMAGRVHRGDVPVVVLCGGTSGSGKSTTANLIASHLGIRQVLCTDTVRQVLRGQVSEEEYKELFVSTYEAFRSLPQQRRGNNGSATTKSFDAPVTDEMVIEGYEAQTKLILQVLDGILERTIKRGKSIVVEGTHLTPNYMVAKQEALFKRRILCFPVLLQVREESRHKERFCTRAKSMTLQPTGNKYISSFPYIRVIHSYISAQASTLPHLLTINNNNVDSTLMVVHNAMLQIFEHIEADGWPRGDEKLPCPEPVKVDEKKLLSYLMRRLAQEPATAAPKSRAAEDNVAAVGSFPSAVSSTKSKRVTSATATTTTLSRMRAHSAFLLSAFHKRLIEKSMEHRDAHSATTAATTAQGHQPMPVAPEALQQWAAAGSGQRSHSYATPREAAKKEEVEAWVHRAGNNAASPPHGAFQSGDDDDDAASLTES